MTFQPPPPTGPPGSAPPPPPPPAAGGARAFDPKSINPLDWGIIAAGVLAFIFSFISFYVADFSSSGSCPATTGALLNAAEDAAGSESAWHGFFGWFAVLLAIVGAAALAVMILAPQVKLPIAARLVALGAFALATLSMILALFIDPESGRTETLGGNCTVDGSVGRGFGYWVTFIVIIAGLVLSLMRFQATGGTLPGGFGGKVPNIGGYGPQDRPTPGGPVSGPRPGDGTPPPPPPGYGPPQ